ncbi:SDR family oxidoreductase [Leifsonia sp. SIMBA_070]|uniref:SDR family oxidoreductase n=1 Tax=Leifsonia sp. SIMBA_070 TaxID=3085810 RepID=UPI0039780E7D
MTRVAIIGAHGKVAQQLMRVLYDLGDDFVGVVRNDEHADDVYRLGGEGVLVDLERSGPEALASAIAGCDAIVFTAGAGAGSGIERKRTVDYGGSITSQAAARQAGVRRFVQVSAWGADAPVDDSDPVWKAYVEAKRDADTALRDSGLDWTILRPGGLTTDEGTGLITLGDSVPRGSIAREDVARLIALALHEQATIGHQWEVIGGDTPIEDAVRSLVASA